jgi:hypothetical protein
MVLDAVERVLEELERVVNPRELTLLVLAVVMVAFGAAAGPTDSVAVAMIAIGSGMFFVGIFLPVLTEFKIGPGGFSAKLRERNEEVRASIEPHAGTLGLSAAALAGTPEGGRKLLEQVLVETVVNWHEVQRENPVEAVIKQLEVLAPVFAAQPAQPEGQA